jgi:hypothetical protein
MKALRLPILTALLAICLLFVVIALLEGMSSLALAGKELRSAHLAEEHFTERDTLLGWINLANADKRDLFGPGRSLRTNGQRFRHSGALAAIAPAGKRRVVCSGDSFTLGYGVDDRDTWCALLARENPSLETVNMGQGGYGIDQAYLWYLRDGLPLRPQAHVFAFIADDFRRMGLERFFGFPKPKLALDGSALRTVGVPVPNPGIGPSMDRLSSTVRGLRTFQVLKHFSARARSGPATEDPAKTLKVAHAAFRDLATRDSLIGAKLVVVYLPMFGDFLGNDVLERLRTEMRESAQQGNYEFVDLVEELRRVPPDSVRSLFIQSGDLAFSGAAGHYTEAGNAWVTKQLLARVPALAAR